MDYRKQYNEALKRAKYILTTDTDSSGHQAVTYIFPELKESEDEKIRKELLEHCTNRVNGKQICVDASDYRRWAAWLEKQGERETDCRHDEAEKEKYDFVSGQYIECRKSFDEFKEDNSYWFEYIGDDTYIGRSDNILNKKFHITPRQLYTLFSWQHSPKDDTNEVIKNEETCETNAPIGYGKYVDDCLNGVRCGKNYNYAYIHNQD